MRKIKTLGKNSISSIFFWVIIVYLTFIIIELCKMLIAPENYPISYNVWETFKLNLLFALPQLIVLPVLLFILNVFTSTNIFSKRMVFYLNLFAFFCFTMPLIKILVSFLFFDKDLFNGDYFTALYIFLGVLSIFISSIFKKGTQIQQENDLTI